MLVNTKTNVTSLLVIDDKVAYLTFSSKTWISLKSLVCLKALQNEHIGHLVVT